MARNLTATIRTNIIRKDSIRILVVVSLEDKVFRAITLGRLLSCFMNCTPAINLREVDLGRFLSVSIVVE